MKTAFSLLGKELDFSFTVEPPENGALRLIVGRKVIKEAWEVEAEKRTSARARKFGLTEEEVRINFSAPKRAIGTSSLPPDAASTTASAPELRPKSPLKESWEVEMEQGLHTEAGQRKARAAAAQREIEKEAAIVAAARPSPNDLTGRDLYDSLTHTLTLPTSVPPTMSARHGRSISLAFTSGSVATERVEFSTLPTPTLPLEIIASQPFAHTLRVLVLNGRRFDKSFALPPSSNTPVLPFLEQLSLEGCNLNDSVPVTSGDSARENKPLLPLISSLFPSLRSLNLAYNNFTSSALEESDSTLSSLILASQEHNKPGLRVLELRGNKLTSLDAFASFASLHFKGNRVVGEWKLEELDIRDNEIPKLPAEMGLLPLEVFLVEGNT